AHCSNTRLSELDDHSIRTIGAFNFLKLSHTHNGLAKHRGGVTIHRCKFRGICCERETYAKRDRERKLYRPLQYHGPFPCCLLPGFPWLAGSAASFPYKAGNYRNQI
ncbi:hypothetical protein, partial [Cupriavidus sp. L7L]|uniref:hypothetical protein n=1 Tax=Cupriavidus sp. L7L TaxID=2546443 RepID=UPI0014042DB7